MAEIFGEKDFGRVIDRRFEEFSLAEIEARLQNIRVQVFKRTSEGTNAALEELDTLLHTIENQKKPKNKK